MSTIPPVYPAHTFVSQAEVRLVADEIANVTPTTIKSDEQRVQAAQAAETADAKTSGVDLVA